jgi:hypothetical protein
MIGVNDMDKKETDEKIYRVYKDRNNHINTKTNEYGRRAAIQFDNKGNKLNGPVDIEEVDIDELLKSQTPKEINPYVRLIIDRVVAPYIKRELEIGTDKMLSLISQKGIPTAKKAIKEFAQNKSVYIEGIRDGLSGKETKASRLLREAEEKRTSISDEVETICESTEHYKEVYSSEEVQQVIDTLKKSVLVTATCIRILANTIVKDNGTNPEVIEETKKQLEKLNTQEVMNQISLMLEEKNRDILDESSYHILYAFRQGNLIVDGEMVPIAKYLNCNDE